MRPRVRADLHASPRQIGDRRGVEQRERARALRQLPLVRSTEKIAHEEHDGGNSALLEQRKRVADTPIAIIEREQERMSRESTPPLQKAHELVRRHEPIVGPPQRIQLALELFRGDAVPREDRIVGQVGDGVIAEHAKRMRARYSSTAMDASPVLDGADSEERQRRETIGVPATDPPDDELPERCDGEPGHPRRHEYGARE